jgi:2-dehydro-3-deoxyglucarate aldolase/4-hydroxy-2-oxoheptanedioate aldolase
VEDAIRLGRTISHLGMVPLVRIVELSRTHVQRLLDGGVRVLTLPDVRNGAEAVEFARLGKYPPVGDRGVSSTSGGTDFALKPDVQQALRDANDSTHLMVMLEGDEGLSNLANILAVQAVDMVTVGPMDWAVGLGVFGAEAQARMAPKIESVLTAAAQAGKITAMGGATTTEQAQRYRALGVRIFFLGPDISLKRKALADAQSLYREALGSA